MIKTNSQQKQINHNRNNHYTPDHTPRLTCQKVQ